MKTVYKIFVVTVMLMIMSCGDSENEKPSRKMRIPEDKLVRILTDTYLTAGMMDLISMRETWAQRDSIQNYADVIESHGYTYEQFETTMRYYFTGKPRKLSRIYDRVTGNLLELETEVMTQQNAVKPSEKTSGQASPTTACRKTSPVILSGLTSRLTGPVNISLRPTSVFLKTIRVLIRGSPFTSATLTAPERKSATTGRKSSLERTGRSVTFRSAIPLTVFPAHACADGS